MARPSHTLPLPLSASVMSTYLENDLANELHWLLRAATEWYIQDSIHLEIGGYHMQVFAMDSAFLHARTLFEFFTKTTTGNYYGYNAYRINMPMTSVPGGRPRVDTIYLSDDWENPLHAYLMHAQDRTVSRMLTSFDRASTKDIKTMPVDFAQEVVRLWREFITKLGGSPDPNIKRLEPIALKVLSDAIAQTDDVYTRKRVVKMKRKYPIGRITW